MPGETNSQCDVTLRKEVILKIFFHFCLPVIEGLISEGVAGAPEPRVGVAVLVVVVDRGGVPPLMAEPLPLAVDVLDGDHLGRGAGVVEQSLAVRRRRGGAWGGVHIYEINTKDLEISKKFSLIQSETTTYSILFMFVS